MHHILRGIRYVRARYGRRPAETHVHVYARGADFDTFVTDAVAEAIRENDRRRTAAPHEGRR